MKISVVIPAYYAQDTIARAIQSVLNQTRPADEIIVIDDGSSDNTAQAAGSFGEKVTVIRQTNAGASVARNKGIEASHGEWIAFLDADDEWLPDKLKLQSEQLQRHPRLKWSYTNLSSDKTDRGIVSPIHPAPLPEMTVNASGCFEDYLYAYRCGFFASTITLMIHRSVFDSAGLFEVGMRRAQDTDLWFRIAYQYPQIGYLPESLSIYHLDTPASSTKINDTIDFMMSLVQRHENLSRQYNRYDAFRPCITQMLQVWTRRLLEQKRHHDAEILLDQFRDYLPARFRREMRFRMSVPLLGPAIADTVLSLKKRWKHK